MAARAAKLGQARKKAAEEAARNKPPPDAAQLEREARVREQVLRIFEGFYDLPAEQDPLQVDPNEFDVDPSPFYQALEEAFDLAPAEPSASFNGLGGTLGEAIRSIAERWRAP